MLPPGGVTFDEGFREQLQRLFAWRRDVRSFRSDPVDSALLQRLLGVCSLAPSVGLSQPWRFVLVTSAARREAVRASFARCNAEALAMQKGERAGLYARLKLAGLEEAPCHLAVFAEPDPAQGGGLGRRTMPEMAAYSAVIAVHTLWLAARAEGLGMGWVSILDPCSVRDVLDVPATWQLVAYLCLGYPQADQETPELERAGWEWRRAETIVIER